MFPLLHPRHRRPDEAVQRRQHPRRANSTGSHGNLYPPHRLPFVGVPQKPGFDLGPEVLQMSARAIGPHAVEAGQPGAARATRASVPQPPALRASPSPSAPALARVNRHVGADRDLRHLYSTCGCDHLVEGSLALIDSADPVPICLSSSKPRGQYRFSGSLVCPVSNGAIMLLMRQAAIECGKGCC